MAEVTNEPNPFHEEGPRWETPVVLTLRGYLPESMNRSSSGYGSHWSTARSAKKRCEKPLRAALIASALPPDKSARLIVVDGLLTFPMHRKSRDSDNFKMLLAKALGDVLQERWLVDDDHTRYRFGILAIEERRGVRQTKLRIAWARA